MTNRFYHAGHLGDLVCSLYTVKALGGGQFYIGDHFDGDWKNWGKEIQEAAVPLCRYQTYISCAKRVDSVPENLTYNFIDSWRQQRTDNHFEYSYDSIASCGLKKRDFINVMMNVCGHTLRDTLLLLNHDIPWLSAPRTKDYDVVCHLPSHKVCRDVGDWRKIFKSMKSLGYSIAMIGGEDVEFWEGSACDVIKPTDLLDAADYINSSKLFIGVSSCNNAIAEGLDKFRFIECEQAWGTEPQNERGWKINHWDARRIITSLQLITCHA